MAVVLAAGVVVVAGIDGLGRRAVLRRIERLDEERHGLREAYDRARLDSLRDGLTGLGNHRAFQEELTSRSPSRAEEAAGRSRSCTSMSTTSRSSTTAGGMRPATPC